MFEIVDEAGNIHGPFAHAGEALAYASDRGLGVLRDVDSDERTGGWELRLSVRRRNAEAAHTLTASLRRL